MKFPGSTLALQRLVPVLAGKVTLAEFHALYATCQEDVGERYRRLMAWMELAVPLLPHRSHSRVTRAQLIRFLSGQRGWFRVATFADYFEIHDKTAWEYLKAFKEVGLLEHNGERSSRARYRIVLPHG